METRELTKVALMACIQFVVFTSLSSVLYLEAITLVVILFAMVFPVRQSVLAAMVFGCLNMFVQGITIFSMMYVIIYPGYTLLVYLLRPLLARYRWLLVVVAAMCSFATGMLLDIPFMLFSKRVTMVYLLLGLKTSLIQGALTAILMIFLYDYLYLVLMRIEKKGCASSAWNK